MVVTHLRALRTMQANGRFTLQPTLSALKISGSTNANAKVLIVGGGPVGLITALALLRNGVRPRVIEKDPLPRVAQRGSATWPRTIEIYESYGFIDQFMKFSIPFPKIRTYSPGSTNYESEIDMVPDLPATPDRPYRNPRFLGQNISLKIIHEELFPQFDFAVERGTQLVSIEQVGERVHVKIKKQDGDIEDATYDYVVGVDGARGVVRKQLGLTFQGETRVQSFNVGDIMVEGLATDRWHFFGRSEDMNCMFRPCEIKGKFSYSIGGANFEAHPAIADSEDSIRALMRNVTGNDENIKFGEFIVQTHYTVNIRIANTFRKGRVFVAGDAAHVQSPAGGQGLNTGVQDAHNLGWKLALVVRGLASPSLLDTYDAERRPVVAEMLKSTSTFMQKALTDGMDKAVSGGGWSSKGALDQLGVNYRISPIVQDDAMDDEARTVSPYGGAPGGQVFAGDRAPDATGLVGTDGEGVRLFDTIFHNARHSVLVFVDNDPDALQSSHPIFGKYPADLVRFFVIQKRGNKFSGMSHGPPYDVYEDAAGHVYEAYKSVEGLGIFVIRPDGYVGARVQNFDRVAEYFNTIFV